MPCKERLKIGFAKFLLSGAKGELHTLLKSPDVQLLMPFRGAVALDKKLMQDYKDNFPYKNGKIEKKNFGCFCTYLRTQNRHRNILYLI